MASVKDGRAAGAVRVRATLDAGTVGMSRLLTPPLPGRQSLTAGERQRRFGVYGPSSAKLIHTPATAPVPGPGAPSPYRMRWADTVPGQRSISASVTAPQSRLRSRSVPPSRAPWVTDRWASGAPTQAAVTLYWPARGTTLTSRILRCRCRRARSIRRPGARPVRRRGQPPVPQNCGFRPRQFPGPGSVSVPRPVRTGRTARRRPVRVRRRPRRHIRPTTRQQRPPPASAKSGPSSAYPQ